MAKDKNGSKYKKHPEKFTDSEPDCDGNCGHCVDNDICDVPDDDCYNYDDDYIDYDDIWSDDWQDWEDFDGDYDDMQGYV